MNVVEMQAVSFSIPMNRKKKPCTTTNCLDDSEKTNYQNETSLVCVYKFMCAMLPSSYLHLCDSNATKLKLNLGLSYETKCMINEYIRCWNVFKQ